MPTTHVDGYEVFYYDDDFSAPWEPSETILINHYGLGDSSLYAQWVPTLAAKHRVIRWDRPGYGLSEKPKLGYKHTAESLVADTVEFMDKVGLEKVHYVGDKVSTAVGFAFAAAHPDRVASLTLAIPVITGARVQPMMVKTSADAIRLGSWVSAFQERKGFNAYPEGMDRMAQLWYRYVQSLIPANIRSSILGMVAVPGFSVEELLPSIQAPTLLLAPEGTNGDLTTIEEQEKIIATMPNARARRLAGAEFIMTFLNPEWCAQQTLEFIDEISAS